MKKEPMYMNVFRVLSKRMDAGVYKTDELLPPEPQLQEEFQVSRTTIRKAMEMLASEKYVSIKQGKGTKVLDRSIMSQQLNYVSSFTETLVKKGCEVSMKSADLKRVKAEADIADELCIETGEELFLLERVYLSDGRPIGIARNYLIPKYVPGLPDDYRTMKSLYNYIENVWGLTIESAFDRITARSATEEEARILEIPEGSPLLIDHRVSNAMGKPFEVVFLVLDAASYEFSIFMRGRPR